MKKIFIIIIIFLFALSVRLWNLNQMGRTWDEFTYVEWGYNFINLVQKGDFSNPYWYKTSGSPPVSRYLYGVASLLDINHFDLKGKPVFNYDLTFVRLVSVLFSCLTVVVIFLIGWKYISPFIGVVASIVFSLLPLSVGYAQIATLESLILFFFTTAIFSFFNFLNTYSKKNIILAGVFMGLALGVKYSNILLLPLSLLIFLLWYFYVGKNKIDKSKYFKGILGIFLFSFLTFFAIWPMPFFHIKEVLDYSYSLRIVPNKYPSVEVFFGKVMHVPVFYYFIQFLVTVPVIALSLFFVGAKRISDLTTGKILKNKYKFIINLENKWVLYAIILWFCFPFIQSFYNFRQQGIRYIIEIYPPFALIVAIGFDYIVSRFIKSSIKKFIIFVPVIIYLLVVLVRISPYYLDYYNLVVGGTRNVYEKNLFQLGWWGQGIKEAGLYLEKHAQKDSTVGLAIDPIESMPLSNKLKLFNYLDNKNYDYVLLGYYRVTRLGFDASNIKRKYDLVYSVKADGANIVWVYKRKK